MIDGTAVKAIAELKAETRYVVDVEGRQYSSQPLHMVDKGEPEPPPFECHGLTGLVGYIASELDADRVGKDVCVVHVASPTLVRIVSTLHGYHKQRFVYATAKPHVQPFPFGQFMDLEQMNVRLQTQFVETETRADVLRLVGNVKGEQVATVADDGVSQQVTARRSVATVDKVTVPNPVILAPFRTFAEVMQPLSMFVLRMREGPEAALFEADGGAWKNDATEKIVEWLTELLSDAVGDGWSIIA